MLIENYFKQIPNLFPGIIANIVRRSFISPACFTITHVCVFCLLNYIVEQLSYLHQWVHYILSNSQYSSRQGFLSPIVNSLQEYRSSVSLYPTQNPLSIDYAPSFIFPMSESGLIYLHNYNWSTDGLGCSAQAPFVFQFINIGYSCYNGIWLET